MRTLITGAVGACLLLPIGAGAQPIGGLNEPRFKLEALRFKAIDETGFDWLGSDEVKVVIWVLDYPPTRTITKKFENVDTGDTMSIPLDQSCILPIAGLSTIHANIFRGDEGDTWSCAIGGAPGPFSFKVELREIDFWGCYAGYAGCNLIGEHTVVYSLEELTALHVGQVVEESVTLGWYVCYNSPYSPNRCGTYVFTWRLTRLPDAEPVFN